DVPGTGLERVPAVERRARDGPGVGEVRRTGGGRAFGVADRRVGPPLDPAPGRVVALLELAGAPDVVRVVARGEHEPRQRLDEIGRAIVVRGGAFGDVAGA